MPSPSSRIRIALGARFALVAALLALSGPPGAMAGLPPEGRCPTVPRPVGPGADEDATAVPLREGMVLSHADLQALRALLPPELWRFRNAFFFEGMRLEIGPCHRRYAVDPWYAEATRRFAAQAMVDDAGNLEGYVAGLPFPPETIDPRGPDAGVRWAWNFVQRYRGAGPVGSFRLLDLPSRAGAPETYRGTFFFIRTAHRSDLPDQGYRVDGADGQLWVAGGSFTEPTNARYLAWRQMRPLDSLKRYDKPDDTFVYVPTMRKVRRASSAWVDGLYVPRYTVSGTERGGGGIPVGGGNPYGPGGSIQPTAGASAAITEDIRKGFVGLSVRPNAYAWRVHDERPVLAPLNGARSGYPDDPHRNFGPSGLSLASDRWEVRYAVVLEGLARDAAERVGRVTLFLDYQTQQPLYWIGRTKSGRILEVGVLVHRYSADLPRYPVWPDRGRAHVFDPVAASFYFPIEGGTGWRRESYDARSIPLDPGKRRRLLSTDSLARGR